MKKRKTSRLENFLEGSAPGIGTNTAAESPGRNFHLKIWKRAFRKNVFRFLIKITVFWSKFDQNSSIFKLKYPLF